MKFAQPISDGLRPVVDLVYPPRCPLCGEAVVDQGGLCIECWSGIERPGEPCCSACNAVVGNGKLRCLACEIDPPRHSGIHAATIYNEASRKLILSFKHGGKIALAGLLGRMMGQALPDIGASKPLLVPVPLHRWRLWRRGYNQAALLAHELEKSGKGELLVDALVRWKRTPTLGGLGRSARREALSGAIELKPSARTAIAGRNVILVDDVLTSGATSEVCVAALLDGGAERVRIVCFARVIDGSGLS